MTTTVPTPLASAAGDDHRALGEGIAAHIARLETPPRLLGLGEPLHGDDTVARIRNALFAALVDRAGFTAVALETSAWHARLVDDHVRGGDTAEDDVMTAGFTHGFGASAANRALVRWMREQNRHRPGDEQLRFHGFDAPTEMAWAPSPRATLRILHDLLHTHGGGELDLPGWDTVEALLGPDEPWSDPAAAWEAARSIGGEPRVGRLRALTDDLRRTLVDVTPQLRHRVRAEDLAEAQLAGRTAAGLLAYHQAMARDTEHRWQRLSALRDGMMTENLEVVAEHDRTLVFAHNQHLRTRTTSTRLGTTTLRWQPAGAHLADRLPAGAYRVVAGAIGRASHLDIPEPDPDTLEGVLHDALPAGNHLLRAGDLRPRPTRVTANRAYFPVDDALLDEVDEVLFLPTVTPETAAQDSLTR